MLKATQGEHDGALILSRDLDGRSDEDERRKDEDGDDVQESRNGVQHAHHSTALLLMSSDGEGMAAQMNLTNSHLATDQAAFDPLAYQQGSVWAFDNALIVSGLRRYGEDAAALRVTAATLDAARGFRNGRLPEFIARAQRLPGDAPTHTPRADPLQAWSAAATPFMVSELLSLSADGFAKRLYIRRPLLTDGVGTLALHRINVGDAMVSLRFTRDGERRVRSRYFQRQQRRGFHRMTSLIPLANKLPEL